MLLAIVFLAQLGELSYTLADAVCVYVWMLTRVRNRCTQRLVALYQTY